MEQSANMLNKESFPEGYLLVLENADPLLVLEDHLPDLSGVPILVTSTNPAIGNWTLHPDHCFHLSQSADYNAISNLVRSIKKCFNPHQCVTTLVANGGSGKTQVVLKFVAEYTSR